jgi:hypothetical protein
VGAARFGGEHGDHALAHLQVAQQSVHPGPGARVGRVQQEFQQGRLLGVGQLRAVQQVQDQGRDEGSAGLLRIRGVQQAGRSDPGPAVQSAAQGVERAQRLRGHPGSARLLFGCRRGGEVEQQFGDGRKGRRAAVLGQSAQCFLRPGGVRTGTEQSQLSLVRAAEVGLDRAGEVVRIETQQEIQALCRVVGQLPQQRERLMADGAERGCDVPGAATPRAVVLRCQPEPVPQG